MAFRKKGPSFARLVIDHVVTPPQDSKPAESYSITNVSELIQNIRKVFDTLKQNYGKSIPTNIDNIINTIETNTNSMKNNTEYGKDSKTESETSYGTKSENFAGVTFERRSHIMETPKDTIIKKCITRNNHDKKDVYATCSIIMEIAMQQYAYEELQKLQLFNNIHIPRIINYYIESIETEKSCIIEMEKVPKGYITLSEYLKQIKTQVSVGKKRKNGHLNNHKRKQSTSIRLRRETNHSRTKSRNRSKSRVSDSGMKNEQIINTVKDLAIQLSKLFNSIKVLHNDAKVDNIFINPYSRLWTEAYIIDFGRSEMYIGNDTPVLYPFTENSFPTFHTKSPSETYKDALDSFIKLNKNPLKNYAEAVYIISPRLGGKPTRKKRSL
jgi:hypothetical protein